MSASGWFNDWLKFHKAINPHSKFRDYESAGFDEVYAGWVEAFDQRGIDRDKARKASRLMQAEDKREVYPEHHLSMLLGLAARVHAPVNPEEAAADDLRRRLERERVEAEDGEEREIKLAWSKMDHESREKFRGFVRSKHPWALGKFEHYVEFMARNLWADSVKGLAPVIPDPIPPAPEPAPAADPVPAEEPLTAGQLDFLAALAPEQRSAFDSLRPGLRRLHLAPHAGGFDPTLLPVVVSELAPRRGLAATA